MSFRAWIAVGIVFVAVGVAQAAPAPILGGGLGPVPWRLTPAPFFVDAGTTCGPEGEVVAVADAGLWQCMGGKLTPVTSGGGGGGSDASYAAFLVNTYNDGGIIVGAPCTAEQAAAGVTVLSSEPDGQGTIGSALYRCVLANLNDAGTGYIYAQFGSPVQACYKSTNLPNCNDSTTSQEINVCANGGWQRKRCDNVGVPDGGIGFFQWTYLYSLPPATYSCSISNGTQCTMLMNPAPSTCTPLVGFTGAPPTIGSTPSAYADGGVIKVTLSASEVAATLSGTCSQ